MGNIGLTALRPLALALRDELNITTFVETGTYKGETSLWAAGEFGKVVTIEGDKNRYDKTQPTFKGVKNIRSIYGDSRKKLKGAIGRLRKPALLWLDAHWCGNYEKSAGTPGECPIADELKIVADCPAQHIIMIDDARYFLNAPPMPHDPAQWPTLDEIKALLPGGYKATIWNDAIIAVPAELMGLVEKFTVESEPDPLLITVLASNEYLHCLSPFAYLFNKYWSIHQPVRVIRYEIRPRNLPVNFTNFAIGKQSDFSWSSGLIKYLNYYEGDLVLLMLEDYFLSQRVNADTVAAMWEQMSRNPQIAKIDLSGDRNKVSSREFNDDLLQIDDEAQFQTSLQAAIWRKDFLLQFLKPDESPWQFEKLGSKRVIAERKKGNFSGLILGCKFPPITYINAIGGEGNHPALWDNKKIPQQMMRELKGRGLISG